jgi:hypothetical protein
LEHIAEVSRNIALIAGELLKRAEGHDKSKLGPEEKEVYDACTPRLKECAFGNEEYTRLLGEMQPALDRHYAENRHHPEHFPDGVRGMDLADLTGMLCDWRAASGRNGGDPVASIRTSQKRFGFSDDIRCILENTCSGILGKASS